jgi:(E)-4-hydroxy-3-methyl-but-2-enyl pyrophosphate reductase
MKIEVAKRAGFCFGVKRAVKLAYETVSKSRQPVYTLGPIIHNPQVVNDLEACGVKAVNRPSQAKKGTIIIRSHGVHPNILEKLKLQKGLIIVDATCPFVTKAQRAAACLRDENRQVIIVGEREHPEVVALRGYAGKNSVVFNRVSIKSATRVGVLAQTTLSTEDFTKAIKFLCSKTNDIHLFNTICQATQVRQRDTMQLAKRSDVMIVVGGRNSANTSRLAELCRKVGKPTHHVETEQELKSRWFSGAKLVGVTAGASTPDSLVSKVVSRIRDITVLKSGKVVRS